MFSNKQFLEGGRKKTFPWANDEQTNTIFFFQKIHIRRCQLHRPWRPNSRNVSTVEQENYESSVLVWECSFFQWQYPNHKPLLYKKLSWIPIRCSRKNDMIQSKFYEIKGWKSMLNCYPSCMNSAKLLF